MELKKQILGVLWAHTYTALITMAFGLGAFWWFITQDNWKQLYSAVCMFVYFLILFRQGAHCARQDKRDISPQKPYPLKGVVLSLSIAAVTFILWVMYRITWVFMTIDGSISGYSGVVYNFVFFLWTFVYNGIMGLFEGGMFWYAHILIYTFPALGLGLGYYCEYKGIDFTAKLAEKMYEKNGD